MHTAGRFARNSRAALSLSFVLILLSLVLLNNGQAQTATGSILGTVRDLSGAVVADAIVSIRAQSTNAVQSMATTSTGTYSAAALLPGTYVVHISAPNFDSVQMTLEVRVGQTANGDCTLPIGKASITVDVPINANVVNTSQAVVQDVITTEQVETMPLNGRNFLDLAQLNPGVQVQDGGNFDPTKNGFSGLSFQGRSGRETRIEIDGIDISDETVGTTTTNVSEESIQEFQVAQSTLDPATSLTTTGAVNVITRSGSNGLHGSAFYLYRNHQFAAPIDGVDAPFERSQVGFRLGGPFIKDRVFWFVNLEHTLQHGATFVAPPAPFSSFAGTYPTPFHETMGTARVDSNLFTYWRLFSTFHHDQLNGVLGFGGNLLNPFANHNITDFTTVGLDGARGHVTHSIRFGYLRFRNGVVDARSQVASLPFQTVAAGIGVGGSDNFCASGSDLICLGANYLAPQHTYQHNLEIRYDGSDLIRNHTFRYGFQFINIPEAIDASLVGNGPILFSTGSPSEMTQAANGPFPGGSSNPLNYPLDVATFGNGLGYFSERASAGLPHGGFPMKRLAGYAGDVWKIRSNLTLNLAVRYTRDTGRTNNDLAGFPQLTTLLPDAAKHTNQPNLNFGPQAGVVWDPFKNGKTALRAGAGMFYDDFIVNSFLSDRLLRIPVGIGNATPALSFGNGVLPGTKVDISSSFGQPIGSVIDQVVAAQAAYQAANLALSQHFSLEGTPAFLDPNGFAGNTLGGYLDPNFRTPVSTQFNIGVQRQLSQTLLFSVDFLHNTNVHSPLAHDVNLVGAARTLNVTAASAAISATLAACGVSSVQQSLAGCPNFGGRPATIADYANQGLGSPAAGFNGQFVAPNGVFAFAGIDPNFGPVGAISEVGRSTYNAMQFRLQQRIAHPVAGVRSLFWTANYNLSRFNAMVADQDQANGNFALDNVNLGRFYGPNALDRTHMVSGAITADLPTGARLSVLARVYSALPVTLRIPFQCGCPAEIFLTDITGDGSGHDVLTGTNVGAFGRSTTAATLNQVISRFNSSVAGQLTPAGQALVSAGLFTGQQLQALGAVVPSVPAAPAGNVGVDNFVADDLRLSWELHVGRRSRALEGLVLEPSVEIFSLVNKANYDPPQDVLRGDLDGSQGSVNGTTSLNRANRYGLGSGVFSVGIPRAIQFGLRMTF